MNFIVTVLVSKETNCSRPGTTSLCPLLDQLSGLAGHQGSRLSNCRFLALFLEQHVVPAHDPGFSQSLATIYLLFVTTGLPVLNTLHK